MSTWKPTQLFRMRPYVTYSGQKTADNKTIKHEAATKALVDAGFSDIKIALLKEEGTDNQFYAASAIFQGTFVDIATADPDPADLLPADQKKAFYQRRKEAEEKLVKELLENPSTPQPPPPAAPPSQT